MHKAVISGTGLYTPANSISNDELVASFNAYVQQFNADNAAAIERGEVEALSESSSAFIEKASGIKSRFVIDKDGILDPQRMVPRIPERSNDEWGILCEMAVGAAREALERAGRSVADIDGVIVACSNLQRAYPAVAIEVQAALGINGWGYDMNVACSSATFGIQAAVNAVATGQARAVLMVNPEICTGHLNFRDRDSHFIFGDAATAVIIERADQATSKHQWDILGTKLLTQFSNNIRNNFGFLNRAAEEGIGAKDKLFVQEGRKVFKDVCPMVAELIGAHLAENQLNVGDVKRFWLHQANLNMNLLIARKLLGRDAEAHEAPVILDTYANTSSAGSVIAFHKHHDDLPVGSLGVLSSFGAGYSIGSVILRKKGWSAGMAEADAELLARLLAGEQRAFRELVSTYQGAMRAVAYAIVGSRNADEVVQDAWLAVVRNLDGFQQRASLKTWLLTITANTAKSRLKQQRREPLLDDLPAPHGSVGAERFAEDGHWQTPPSQWELDTPEALLAEAELRECLEKTIASLSEMQSSVLLLRERQGLEPEEICNLLDLSLSNVRVLLHRARLKVFATLEHFEETGQC
ncbi:3-oxoacyl-ACP synthase [Aquipseudomonas alcaligenes]|uniref:Beta-ketoacyl-ACP synthase III n=3 Tax=Aquipseudomonas alcaligenes TaxID=43263 RepID=U2ZQX6_AQUA1|nr:hypothetical protein PA6_029_00090 [Pseudomonas alcaligenes NBRC 14159]SUD17774.1 3-oxoacyl-ACP synthase [Pseudomonas alcaligenes]